MNRPWAVAALLLAASTTLLAATGESSSSEEVATDTPAAPPEKPLPALDAPLGIKDRLIGLAQAGSRLVAVGQQGMIVISDDGKTWHQSESPVSAMLTAVRFRSEQEGWIVGYDASILHSTDGGRNWTLQHWDASSRMLYDVLFLDAQRGIAVGGYGSYLTTADGGKNWVPQSFPLTLLGQHFNRLIRLGDGTLLLVGERGMLARSVDEGVTWQMLQSPYSGSFFGALALDGSRVLVYGMRGNIYVSDDVRRCPTQDPEKYDSYAAKTVSDPVQLKAVGWRRLDVPLQESIFNAQRLADGSIVLVGVNGTVLKVDAGLNSVTPLQTPASETLADLLPHNGRLLAVGRRGLQDLGATPGATP